MTTIESISNFLNAFAPTRLAEDWDNVGLLVGDPALPVSKIMTCLTITPESATEAIERSANLIVTHHPLPFHPLKRITTEQPASKMLWDLIRAGIGIYSPHTGFDSAADGINQNLAARIGLTDIHPLLPIENEIEQLGAGRVGRLNHKTLGEVIEILKGQLDLKYLQYVGDRSAPCFRVAVACGAAGSFLGDAIKAGCDTFVTGETHFHTCLEAKAKRISLILLGHHASERFAVELLAHRLQVEFADLTVWASERETDPIQIG